MDKSDNNDRNRSLLLSWEVILDEYKQALETAGRSPKTINGYLENMKRYRIFLEKHSLMKPVHKLGIKEVREYIAQLQKRIRWPDNPYIKEENKGRLSPFTVQAYTRDIKTFWSWMCKEGYIDHNPLVILPLPSVPENLIKIISPENFKTLLYNIDSSTSDGPKYRCILLIFYDNGMRLSELVNIEISNIDFPGKSIKIMGKGRRERLVPISVDTRRQIQKYIEGARLKSCPEDCKYLFANLYGDPISETSVRQFLRRLPAKSGLEGVKLFPHKLRHSFATQFLANGGSIDLLRVILGHKSLTTTLKYTHLQQQDIQKQHAKFSPVAQLFRKNS